jgi:hypothetical protein
MNTRAVAMVVLAALLLAGCTVYRSTSGGGPPVITAASPVPLATPPPGCVNPPTDVTTLVDQTDPLSCYGNADLTFDAHLTSAGAADCPGGLEPAWLSCTGLVLLNPLRGTSRQPEYLLVARSQTDPLYAVIHPDIEALRSHVIDTLIHLTGHYDDPAAQSCRYTSWPDANPPSADQVIHQCRSTFVITAVELLKP